MEKIKNIYTHSFQKNKEERMKILNQKGIVLWFTGLSGSGKSTIAQQLSLNLLKKGKINYILDGDNIRNGLNKDLSFSLEDREENIRRVAEVASLFRDCGIITLVTFITPLEKYREKAKKIIGKEYFKEIFLSSSFEVCCRRDPKGLYKKALNGEIKEFTGVSSPYEKPKKPSIEIDTSKLSIEESVTKIELFLNNNRI